MQPMEGPIKGEDNRAREPDPPFIESQQGKEVERRPVERDAPPTRGWQALMYKLFVKIGLSSKAPRPNRAERRSRAVAWLRYWHAHTKSLIFTTLNKKGGAAKTTTLVWVVSVISEIARAVVWAVDANTNGGTTASRLGKRPRDVMSLRELFSRFTGRHSPSFDELVNDAKSTVHGVRPVGADDPRAVVGEYETIGRDETIVVIDGLSRNAEVIGFDGGNNMVEGITLGAMEKSSVLVFTVDANMRDSLIGLGETMSIVANWNGGVLADHVYHSVVSISRMPWHKKVDDYRIFLNYVENGQESEYDYGTVNERPASSWNPFTYRIDDVQIIEESEHLFKGQFVAIPSDRYIKTAKVTRLPNISWRAFQAYLEAAVVIYEQAAKLEDVKAAQRGRHADSGESFPEGPVLESQPIRELVPDNGATIGQAETDEQTPHEKEDEPGVFADSTPDWERDPFTSASSGAGEMQPVSTPSSLLKGD